MGMAGPRIAGIHVLLYPWWGGQGRTVLGLHAPLTVQCTPAMGEIAGILCACTSLSCLVTAALMRYLPPCSACMQMAVLQVAMRMHAMRSCHFWW